MPDMLLRERPITMPEFCLLMSVGSVSFPRLGLHGMFLRAKVLCKQQAQTPMTRQEAIMIASQAACAPVTPLFSAWALTWSASLQLVLAKSMTYPFLIWLWSSTTSPYSSYFWVCKLSMKLHTVSSLFSWLVDYIKRQSNVDEIKLRGQNERVDKVLTPKEYWNIFWPE